MLFPFASLSDYAFRLLLIRPDHNAGRGRPVEISHRIDTTIGEGLTSLEERRPGRAAMLLTQKCTLSLAGAAADDFRKGLVALGSLPVGVPLWIDALPVARWSERIYEPQQVINFNDKTGEFVLYAAGDVPSSPPHPLLAPLLIGRFKNRPTVSALAAKFAEVDLTVAEASPWSCRIGVHAQSGGWTALPDRKSAPVKDTSDYGLETFSLSAAREPALDRIHAQPRWRQEGDFTLRDRLEIRRHLTHFVAQGGALAAWSPVPAWFQPGGDTTGTPSAYTARFVSDTLTLSYVNGAVARTHVAMVQQLASTTHTQQQPGEVFLYRFSYALDPTNPELFTNWDAPLTATEGTYQPAQISAQEILRSLRPQDEKAEIKCALAAGSLLHDWMRGRLFAPVTLTVWQCDPANPTGTRTAIFGGRVTSVMPNGNELSVTAQLLGALLKQKAPGWVYGPRCNTYLFSPRCGLVEADHASAGTASPADLSADGHTLTVHDVAGWGSSAPGGYAAHWFAAGVLRTGTGRARQIATIVDSSMSGGDVVVQLNRPLWPDLIGSGQAVTLLPGCGLQYVADCGTKFSNQANFRGFPFIPPYIETRASAQPKTPKK